MIALIQRVTEARVEVDGDVVGAIGRGILALVGVERGDGEAQAERLVEKVLGYRIFPDAEGKMNRSLLDIGGELLAVPQFTLAADTKTGTRAGFSTAASPEDGQQLVRPFRRACPAEKSAYENRPLRRRHEGQPRQRRARDFLAAGFSIETVLKFAGATISSSSRSFEWLSSRCRMPGGW